MRRGLVAAIVGALALCAPLPAHAAQRLVTIATPSAFVDPATVAFNGGPFATLEANVLLPDGYDEHRTRRWPVLFLLHGVGDNHKDWANPARGDIARTAKDFPGIIVMPEGARGFYTDWWNGGKRGSPGWESYDLRELVPLVQRRFRVLAGRRWHAIAGLSMGGMGAAYLAGQLPGFFGSAALFSGFVDHQRPEIQAAFSAVAQVSYTDIFGPIDGFYATAHDPSRIPANLRATRVFVAAGNGLSQPGVPGSPGAATTGGLVEAEIRQQNDAFVEAARAAGVAVTYRTGFGVHDWPYWRRYLREAIAWGLFAPVEEQPEGWTYDTSATEGRMWDLRYRFAAPPERVERFVRNGIVLRGEGSGTVTVETARNCSLTLALPFEVSLPVRRGNRCGPQQG